MGNYRTSFLLVAGVFLAFFVMRFALFVLFKSYAPFLNRKKRMAEDMIKELQKEKLSQAPVIYSLGSGQFGFLLEAAKMWPEGKFVGVARHWSSYLMSFFQIFWRKAFWQGRLKVRRTHNFYKLDMADADIVIFYQGFEVLKELAKKLKFECKGGTIILSSPVAIPDIKEKRNFFLAVPEKKHWFKKSAPKAVNAQPGKGLGWEIYFLYEI
jgi:hypothetical protein